MNLCRYDSCDGQAFLDIQDRQFYSSPKNKQRLIKILYNNKCEGLLY